MRVVGRRVGVLLVDEGGMNETGQGLGLVLGIISESMAPTAMKGGLL